MPVDPPSPVPCRTLAVVGVGLIGGSIACGAKARGLAQRVVGIGRTAARLQAAQAAGVIDAWATDLAAAADAELAIVCTPVDRLAADVVAVAERLGPGGCVTDVGSLKGSIVRAVAATAAARKYVPSHPLAGSEQAGWEASSPTLFEQRLCVVTPFTGGDPARLDRVEAFWHALGMRTTRLDADEHDRLLALTSHLPHVVAAALARLVGDTERPFTATGFRDTTRIAAGDPAVWTPIVLGNAAALVPAIERLEAELRVLKSAAAGGDARAIDEWLGAAKRRRDELTL